MPVAVQFAPVTNCSERSVAISNLVSLTTPRAGSRVANTVDQIHVWNGSNWNIYYNQSGVGFVKSDAADKAVPTSDVVNAGDGVFFRRANYNTTTDITTAGGIYEGESVSYTLTRNSFTVLSYPWPCAFEIAKFATIMTNPRAGTRVANTVDQVHIWNGSNWTIYYNQSNVGFVRSDADDKTVPTSDTIAPGDWVFFRRANYNANAVVTFTKPEGI